MSTNEVMELTWDYENRLTRVLKKPSEDATPTGTFSYQYDAFDRRIQKNINGKITSYIYDRDNILLEYDGDGDLRAKYTHNTSATDDVLMMEREDTPYRNEAYPKQEFYFHKDRLGNITEVTDYAGIVVQRYVYDAFGSVTIFDKDGNQITPTSPTYLENPYTFTGREYDPETGFYYYRARYYDPSSGRFLSEDPIGVAGGDINFYRYVANNPANLTDPLGLYRICTRPLKLTYFSGLGDALYAKDPSLYSHVYIQYRDGSTTSFGPISDDDDNNNRNKIFGGPGGRIDEGDESKASCGKDMGTDEQERRMKEYAEENYNQKYHLFNNNCKDFVAKTILSGS